MLQFVGPASLEDRTLWKTVLSELQMATLPQVRVKPEPGTEAAAAEAAAAPSAATVAAAASTAAQPVAPAAKPTVRAGGAKRPHSELAGSAAAAAASAAVPAAPAAAAAAAPPSVNDLQSLIQSRAALLAREVALKELHSELVPSHVTEDEFWASPARAAQLRAEQIRQNPTGALAAASGGHQRVARAGVMVVRPGSDGAEIAPERLQGVALDIDLPGRAEAEPP